MVCYALNIILGSKIIYRLSIKEDLSDGIVELLIRGDRSVFCNFSSGMDLRLLKFAESYGLPIRKVNTWLSLVREGGISSIITWEF